MKITKIGLAIAVVSAILFVAGCASNTTAQQPKAKTYQGKLGTTSTKSDVKK